MHFLPVLNPNVEDLHGIAVALHIVILACVGDLDFSANIRRADFRIEIVCAKTLVRAICVNDSVLDDSGLALHSHFVDSQESTLEGYSASIEAK